ncbi:LysR family transcriptional regulator [Sodalis ligni]|uniref:DNA-binding transcriptional LysR family regulator n=1 Tax=Sodalis ligni TaxID=2697027 RepID=A0A4R1N7P3_9GAMM|nr:LysR family transcriptional regulator [Sodalis ligni]TCL03192.1 DNA-binding transcriptional LysR family regulator [Sodalis ligni]
MYSESYPLAEVASIPSAEHSLSDPYMMARMLFFMHLGMSGSISSASEKMGVSISSGSRWLADLEKDIGCQLYRRNNKSQRLTEAGVYLHNKFFLIHEEVCQLKRALSDFSTVNQGTIRICCTPVYAGKFLIPIVARYLAMYKRVNFTINVSAFGIRSWKEYDIIIGAINSLNSHHDDELPLVRRNLMCEPFVTVASPAYLALNGEPKHPSELSQYHCLYASSLTGGNEWAYALNDERHFYKVAKSLEICDSALLRKAVMAGAGIAYLPRYVVQQDINSGRLATILNRWKTSDWLLNLYYPSQRYMTGCLTSFKEYLLEQHAKVLEQGIFAADTL